MEVNRNEQRLVNVALGEEPADLVLKNGLLMDVYTGRMLPGRSVAMADEWIAYVGEDAGHTIGPKTQVIDAEGRTICPGFIDAHTHLVNFFSLSGFLSYAIPCGVTTLVSEVEGFATVLGARGVEAFLDQMDPCPVKLYGLAPPMISLSPAMESFKTTSQDLRRLYEDPRIIGLGESFWQGAILTPDPRVMDLISVTRRLKKSVQGHAAGAFDQKLSAYVATGVESCHEAISTEDVLNRLQLGLYAMIREGDIRRDLEIILPLKDKIDFRRLILVTDGTNPGLLMERGYFCDVVQKAVDLGISPMEAVRMATLNPAEHLGIDTLTGGIAPGRHGDLLLLPGPNTMKPDLVISRGRLVAENGGMRITLKETNRLSELHNTVNVEPLSLESLSVPAPGGYEKTQVRTLDIQPGGLVAREGSAEPMIYDGRFMPNTDMDLLKIVFVERITGQGEKFIGFVKGWGQKKGAVATTLCWDAGGIVAIGENDSDLMTAINRVIELQGGTVVSVSGEVKMEIPLSVAGYVSNMEIPQLSKRLREFQSMMTSLGTIPTSAHLALSVLTTPAIPFIRITEKGYYRFREKDTVGIEI